MKGLRLVAFFMIATSWNDMFLPCDLNEGITTMPCSRNFLVVRPVFTLWPEWRDYDQSWLNPTRASSDTVFTLWPEWRDYDLYPWALPLRYPEGFYLVTWMKGLRPETWSVTNIFLVQIFTLWPEWRDYDLMLVSFVSPASSSFLPCDLNEGITTICRPASSLPSMETCFYLVTWMKGLRLYTASLAPYGNNKVFLPCDLNEGITTQLICMLCTLN